jgi:hypothetical protein
MGASHSLKTMNSHNLEEHTTAYLLAFGLSNKDIWMIYKQHTQLCILSTEFSPNPVSWRLEL